jgi:prevent-host-death family protein
MTTIALTDARDSLGAVIDSARTAPVYLTRHNRTVAVILDIEEFQRLRELAEDAEDAEAAASARREMAETGELPVPWDEVKAELGLT